MGGSSGFKSAPVPLWGYFSDLFLSHLPSPEERNTKQCPLNPEYYHPYTPKPLNP